MGSPPMNTAEMTAKIAAGRGFIAALDQSGGSTPKALKGYGIEEGAWSNDAEMFDLIHQMRVRIIFSPVFTGDKPIAGLDDLLARAVKLGMFGTKERAVINAANREGIAAIVKQQFEVAQLVRHYGLVPIIEPEVNIKSADRGDSDASLTDELKKALDAMPGDARVMLKLSLPVKAGQYADLVDHPRVLHVVALSGGFHRDEACAELAKNPGMIASFSRALLEDLRCQMTDA